jgi:predicted GH43/DUF377 family glycosyl hydrolase
VAGNLNSTPKQISKLSNAYGVNWTKYESNLVLPLGGSWEAIYVGYPSVIKDDSATPDKRYKMWYGGCQAYEVGLWRIGYAYSSDGINWTKYENNPVLDLGANGEWDDVYVEEPSVILDGGTYKMWYAGYDGSNIRIGYATSLDGISWTKSTSNPVLDLGADGEWDDVRVSNSSVILDGGTYRMWYTGNDGTYSRNGHSCARI